MYQPTPNTGKKRPDDAPASNPIDNKRAQSGYGRNTPTDQAKLAYSTRQAEDKARRPTAELTGMSVKYKAELMRALP